jgi:hypothetical protein
MLPIFIAGGIAVAVGAAGVAGGVYALGYQDKSPLPEKPKKSQTLKNPINNTAGKFLEITEFLFYQRILKFQVR